MKENNIHSDVFENMRISPPRLPYLPARFFTRPIVVPDDGTTIKVLDIEGTLISEEVVDMLETMKERRCEE